MAEDPGSPGSFGESIKALRLDAELTQRQLAETVGIDFTYLSKLENGRGERPSEKLVRQLAAVFGADEEDLLAKAGRVPGELGERAQSDLTFARLLRRLPNLSEPELERIYRQAKVKPKP